ncbi:MAG: dockerin type I domain-containing protein [Planctomycetota bacterium]
MSLVLSARRLAFAWIAAIASGLPAPSPGAETYAKPPEGFLARDVLAFEVRERGVGLGGLAPLPDGRLVLYVEGTLWIEGPSGRTTLATFDPPVFGSFAAVAPGGEAVVFGESTEWNIYRVPLDGSPMERIDQVRFAFDLAFGPDGRGYMSVLTNEPANEIVLLDGDATQRNPTVVANIPGYSGPLAFDAEGNLWYGTADYSGDPLRQSLHRFERAQVEAAVASGPIDFSEGEIVLDGMDGFYNLRWFEGKLYGSDLGYAAGFGAIRSIDPAKNYAVEPFVAFEKELSLLSPTFFAFRPGSRPFEAGSGSKGGSLLVGYTDYWETLRVAEVRPELHFIRGEVNEDGVVDISDAVGILGFLFLGAREPGDIEAADSNADGEVDLSDAIYVLNYLFLGGPVIPPPYPERGAAPSSDGA